ncbi:HAD hydrolase family protein [Marivirga arenosa]|uniref:HAD hydrolase family protein n=1 Tax=Marivirga arenosa TaxID=3059076 RepID=A0AA49JD75_9BACT|nr:HAD family hydrolase [Marivirga sp. ABR2-2]WKK83544.2 HAD hydrolase family protein [Marivirga sp. ABR2-2]
MDLLSKNIESYLAKEGKTIEDFLKAYNIYRVDEIKLSDLKLFCVENSLDFTNMLTRPMFVDKSKLKNIKLLILDVDGVMTDTGMYFSENGDQFKKYNAKDGMAIKALPKFGIQTGIISSAVKVKMVKARADMLNIKNVYVGGDPKIEVLSAWCEKMDIDFSEVAIIGDDINDLAVMNAVGFSSCPADAVLKVKETVDLVLNTKGGRGCVREFIDFYLLDKPVE